MSRAGDPDALMASLVGGWVSDEVRLWTKEDTKAVTEIRNRILDAFIMGEEWKLAAIFSEFRGDTDYQAAVWASLPSPVKNFLRDKRAELGI